MRWLVTLFMLVVCGLNAGCSLIGLGIGSTVPEYATYRSPSEALEKQVSVIGEDGNEHSGTLVAAAGNELLLADESHKGTWVVASKLEPLRHKIGDYAATGLALGLAIDVALIAIGAFAFSQVKCITVCGL